MKLDEFVKETLIQIASGTSDAQKAIKDLGGSVNPRTEEVGKLGVSRVALGTDLLAEPVEFDVALVSTTSMAADGAAKVDISVLSIGGGGKAAHSNEATNRVRFKIPLVLPVDIGFGERHKAREEAGVR